jgi:RimJ/RimL family protein N-acetyltransferase
MRLKPLDDSSIIVAAEWMGNEENYKWLDFGGGQQILTPLSLKLMTQRDVHLIRTFASDINDTPLGLVALSNISSNFRTATLWYVLGNKMNGGQGYTTCAVSEMLTIGFEEVGLRAIQAWAVESNLASIRVLSRNHFRFIGRQRCCHAIDGCLLGRLHFDLVAGEHQRVC